MCLCKTSSFPRLFIETSLPSLYLPFLSPRWLFGSLSRHGRMQEELGTNVNCGIAWSGNQTAGLCFASPWIPQQVGGRGFPVPSHPCLLHPLFGRLSDLKSPHRSFEPYSTFWSLTLLYSHRHLVKEATLGEGILCNMPALTAGPRKIILFDLI